MENVEMNLPRECFETFSDWIELWTEVYCLAAGRPVPELSSTGVISE